MGTKKQKCLFGKAFRSYLSISKTFESTQYHESQISKSESCLWLSVMLKYNNQNCAFKSQPIQNFTTQSTLLRSPAHYESCGAIQSITCVLQVDLISRSKELSWFLGIAKFNFALNRKRDIIVPAVPTYLPTYPHWF